jgi:hypothetical protein
LRVALVDLRVDVLLNEVARVDTVGSVSIEEVGFGASFHATVIVCHRIYIRIDRLLEAN